MNRLFSSVVIMLLIIFFSNYTFAQTCYGNYYPLEQYTVHADDLQYDSITFLLVTDQDQIPPDISLFKNLIGICFLRVNISDTNHLFNMLSEIKTLKKLELIECGLKLISENIDDLSGLEYLNIDKNYALTELPDGLFNLTKLRVLIISTPMQIHAGIQRNTSKIGSISKNVKKLKQLEFFEFASKTLIEIPKEITNLKKLKQLCIYGDLIEKANISVFKMKQLTILSIYSQNLDSYNFLLTVGEREISLIETHSNIKVNILFPDILYKLTNSGYSFNDFTKFKKVEFRF